jgi:geranylgeranyl diphosphate synthase type II
MTLEKYLLTQAAKIDKALVRYLPGAKEQPKALVEAMRYAVLSGGKRVRPILALAAAQAVGGNEKDAMPAACALEFIHSYSLVHDDLPCMDDDDMRRGKPTCHVKFGEVNALLAGDALLTQAFQIISRNEAKVSAARQLEVIRLISEAVGYHGMVGGQALDMEFQDKEMNLPTIEYINTHKSGALIAVSTRVGALLGGGSPKEVEKLYRYGKYVGLLFQIADDIMDEQGYAQVIGVHEAKEEAQALLALAKKQLVGFGPKTRVLEQIADFVINRKN